MALDRLRSFFDRLKQALSVTPQERARELDSPSGYETGMRHPTGGGYVLFRDDGVTELGESGHATLLLDGQQGQATLTAPGVSVRSEVLHLHSPELYWRWHRLNEWWTEHPFPAGIGDLAFPTDHAAVVPRDLLSWETLLALPLVIGVPQPGQANVNLREYLELQPLFGPNEELLHMFQHLTDLLGDLEEHL